MLIVGTTAVPGRLMTTKLNGIALRRVPCSTVRLHFTVGKACLGGGKSRRPVVFVTYHSVREYQPF